jgi:hypothetical protein
MTAEWGVETPAGHTYNLPRTEDAVRQRCMDFMQGEIEHWDDPELVPTPTWEVVSVLLEELDRFRHIRAVVEGDYIKAQRLSPESTKNENFYQGARDALDEVRRRMLEVDR